MSRLISIPQIMHIVVAKWILQYIKGTTNYGMMFMSDGSDGSIFYVGTNWAMDFDESKSTIGPFFKFHDYTVLWNNYFTTHNGVVYNRS
jgi:hypothetical protein